MLRLSAFLLFIVMSWQASALTFKSGESINFSSDSDASASKSGTSDFIPLNSDEVQYMMMANPEEGRRLVPYVRESRNMPFHMNPRTVVADFNNDGIDDVVTTGVTLAQRNQAFWSGGRCRTSDNTYIQTNKKGCEFDKFKLKPRLSIGKADGTFEAPNHDFFNHPPPVNSKKAAGYSTSMVPLTADFNGDNIPDLFVLDMGITWNDGDYQALYLSNANGTWDYSTFSHIKNAPKTFSHAGTVGDIDGDGDIDVVTTMEGGQPALLCYFNDGTGHFITRGCHHSVGRILDSLSLADIDGDGDLDAYAGSNSYKGETGKGQWGSGFFILKNNGKGKFSHSNTLPTDGCWTNNPNSFPADVDGDGDMDFVLSVTKDVYSFAGVQFLINKDQGKEWTQHTIQILDWEELGSHLKNVYKIGHNSDKCGLFDKNGRKVKDESNGLNRHIEDIEFGDVDGDGDYDVILKSGTTTKSNEIFKYIHGAWVENTGSDVTQWVVHDNKHQKSKIKMPKL